MHRGEDLPSSSSPLFLLPLNDVCERYPLSVQRDVRAVGKFV